MTNVRVDKLLCCLQEGSAAYAKYIDDSSMRSPTLLSS